MDTPYGAGEDKTRAACERNGGTAGYNGYSWIERVDTIGERNYIGYSRRSRLPLVRIHVLRSRLEWIIRLICDDFALKLLAHG